MFLWFRACSYAHVNSLLCKCSRMWSPIFCKLTNKAEFNSRPSCLCVFFVFVVAILARDWLLNSDMHRLAQQRVAWPNNAWPNTVPCYATHCTHLCSKVMPHFVQVASWRFGRLSFAALKNYLYAVYSCEQYDRNTEFIFLKVIVAKWLWQTQKYSWY